MQQVESSPILAVDRLTPDDRWYIVWRDQAGRNVSEAARILDVPRTTVQAALDRGRWRDRAATDDTHRRGDATAIALARLADHLPHFADTIIAAASVRTDANRKAPPGSPTMGAVKAAMHGLAVFGIAPIRHNTLAVSNIPRADAVISDDELDAMSFDQLLALATGKRNASPPPQDFTDAQPGGRVVPDTPLAVDEDADTEIEAMWREAQAAAAVDDSTD